MLTKLGFALLTVVSFSPLVTSCGRPNAQTSRPQAMSNRPQKEETRKIVLLKFKTPALFSTSQFIENTLVMDQEQEKALDLEQQETEKFLRELSREIKILHRYRFVLNGFSVLVPKKFIGKLKEHVGISEVHDARQFSRPEELVTYRASVKVGEQTSVKFIGAEKVQKEMSILNQDGHLVPVDGRDVRIGVIDTGIDYTHKMLGGPGTEEAYKAIDPTVVSRRVFPNLKVVGGTDLVGTAYDDDSLDFNRRIPQPDANPIDESGHGTHVAGTIAGVGDGENTYTGVAPGAKLYAIKVFGKTGSTSDAVVLAALEYAANPSGNRNPNDHLDLVNLSLGSPFGMPYRLYDEAIANIVKIGMLPVVSAGNSGNFPYVVGSPSTSAGALSVASSIDYMEHNWKFKAVLFKTPKEEIIAKAVESPMAKPLDSVGNLTGKLVYIGFANQELSAEQKRALLGNVALIDRGGGVPFFDILKCAADAGATGVVVASHIDGEPISMGGQAEKPFEIPAVMISKAVGIKLKKALMNHEEPTIQFKTPQVIEEPSIIDTLSSFSSRGPRSFDAAIKPEIAAPGTQIISAQMGSGFKGVTMSGTSMAAPHAAGCVALFKQFHPDWATEQIKSALMANSLTLRDRSAREYSIASQGAGRIEIFNALHTQLTTSPAALALGEIEVLHKKELHRSFMVKNQADTPMTIYFQVASPDELHFDLPDHLTIPEHGAVQVPVMIVVDAPAEASFKELSAFIKIINEEDDELVKIPALAQVRKLSLLRVEALKGHASCPQDAEDCPADLVIRNDGPSPSQALIFNLIDVNPRLNALGPDKRLTELCDLESVGYRTIEQGTGAHKMKMLQFAAKLHSPLTNWQHCELSIQIDGDGDGQVDQELLGASLSTLIPSMPINSFATILTDAELMRQLRADFEKKGEGGKADYGPAIIDHRELKTYEHGTLMVLSVPVSALRVRPFGLVKVKIASLAAADPSSTPDNFLGLKQDHWWTIDPFEKANPYFGMPESVELPAHTSLTVALVHGESSGKLVVYFPFNRSSHGPSKDLQSEIVGEDFIYK